MSGLLSFGVHLGASHFPVALLILVPLQVTYGVRPSHRDGFLFGHRQLIMEKQKGRIILEPWLEQYGGVFAVPAPLGSSTGEPHLGPFEGRAAFLHQTPLLKTSV
jgi:hypothetical protein